jgi:hypothetical protein
MPNIQMLNLADVYAKADVAKAAQQQATLRDLQIGAAQRQQQQELGLSDLAKQSVNPESGELDLGAMSRGAAGLGAYQQATQFQTQAGAARKQKMDLTKEQAVIMGQLADENVVNDEVTYQRWLGQLNEFDPKAGAAFAQKFPNYSKETVPILKQIGQQGMTSLQRTQLELKDLLARLKAEAKENTGMKASDTNALTRLAAQSLNLPFTPQPDGSTLISALNPQQASKLSSLLGRASQNYMAGKGKLDHATAFNNAMDELRGTFPDLPRVVRAPGMGAPIPSPGIAAPGITEPAPPGGFKPMPASDRQKAQLYWQDEKNRPEILKQMKANGYDPSFLMNPTTPGSVPSGPGIPTSTVKSSAQMYAMRQERDAAKSRVVAIEDRLKRLQRDLQLTPEGPRNIGLQQEVQALAQERQGLVDKIDSVTKEIGRD